MSTTLDKILTEFKTDKSLQSLYRIESHQSSHNIQIEDTGTIYCKNSSMYTYFSITERHHHYFAEKRLKNYLDGFLKNQAHIPLNKKTILNGGTYRKIKNIIIQAEFDPTDNFSSIKIHMIPTFQTLLRENAVVIERKHLYTDRLPERSDPQTYKGGYGICGPWLDLLLQLTFFYESHHLNKIDYLRYLEIIRYLYQNGYYNTKGGKKPFLDDAYYQLKINDSIFSQQHKYSIIKSLEQIREENLVLPQSKLDTDFRQEVRNVVKNYEDTREKVLRKLDEHYKKYL